MVLNHLLMVLMVWVLLIVVLVRIYVCWCLVFRRRCHIGWFSWLRGRMDELNEGRGGGGYNGNGENDCSSDNNMHIGNGDGYGYGDEGYVDEGCLMDASSVNSHNSNLSLGFLLRGAPAPMFDDIDMHTQTHASDMSEFYKRYYKTVFIDKQPDYLTEKQLSTGQMVVDLDFRYN